ncbi:hypothetical protein C1X69_17005 [Pseudomonas sp. FW305-67]|nr:hypothetical protein C1X70_27830 [Pseudomonas sp. FW305-53]PMY83553.1 hypothetical protein C1X68_29120 [Pseudomonas sp. FW303-C2]PMY91973.1 hypothetical protein C1X67_15315 [Pseudomonas sp. FW305-62]PNA38451.1 hypothetical protein C1X71_29245 [Pseudomonas sp. FW306-2-2C-A10BC]PNA84519.1 hypothetical protein C1X66_19745 [Pseudomonas sp. MPR-R3B]PNB19863.1 hypothetical protein C1X69_17005 [Pseudomonas sp. FW305-67]
MGGDLWRGGLPPFECVALTGFLVQQKLWGCFATQRGQAPSPQVAPTGEVCFSWRSLGAGCPAVKPPLPRRSPVSIPA